MRNSQSGFAIVYVMVALAAAGAVTYYFMDQQETAAKLNARKKALASVHSASTIIKSSLANIDICTKNLINRRTGDFIPILRDMNDQVIAINGENFPMLEGIRLQSMRIASYKNPQTGIVNDHLYVVYNVDPDNKKKMVGAKTFGKKFLLRGRKNILTGRYQFCYHEESNLVELAAKKSCEDMVGTWSNWQCSLDLTQVVDPTAVNCGTGTLQLQLVAGKLKLVCGP